MDLTPQQFAHLGSGAIAYLKEIRSEDAQRLFPQAPPIRPGLQLFALLERRRLADTADRFQGCGDRQRLGAPAGDRQSPLRCGAP